MEHNRWGAVLLETHEAGLYTGGDHYHHHDNDDDDGDDFLQRCHDDADDNTIDIKLEYVR